MDKKATIALAATMLLPMLTSAKGSGHDAHAV